MTPSKARKAEKTSPLVQALRAVLPAGAVLDRPWELEVYGYDATLLHTRPDVVVLPTTTDEVAEAVRICRSLGVVITPRGSATSLSGGPVPWQGGAVVGLTRMNQILEIDQAQLRAVVQPGVVNGVLNAEAAKLGLLYAPDPASSPACSIGGNVGENAGGPHCFKYGVTANHILGLTVVAADGEILRFGGKELVTPGLDLRGVVVGSEGTLGIATEIVCKLLPMQPAIETMLACFPSVEDAGQAVSGIIAEGLLPATLEMADRMVIDAVSGYGDLGYPRDVDAVLVIEIDGLPEALPPQVERIEAICRKHHALRFERAETEADRQRLWRGRKGATAALSRIAPAKVSSDISVPRRRLAEALHEMAEISERFSIPIANVFHAGDGNLHPQILFDPRNAEESKRATDADDAVTELALRYGGVLTGEHGIGIEKRKWMTEAYTSDELLAMWAVKDAFDPEGRMNPGKVLPPKEDITERLPENTNRSAEAIRDQIARESTLNVPEQSGIEGEKAAQIGLDGLDSIVTYDPESMNVTVGAGMTVGALLDALAEHRQTIGPWRRADREVTVGTMAAMAMPTPGMTMYGAARDVILGLRVVTAEGRDLRVGSCCVKNTSGYALERLFVGNFGTLGIIQEATLRTHPLPEAERRLCLIAERDEAMQALARALIVTPAPIEYARAWPRDGEGWRMDVGVRGWAVEVEAAAEMVLRMADEAGAREWEPFDAPPRGEAAWVSYETVAAAGVACAERQSVVEYWPIAGIIWRAGKPSTAADLYAGEDAETRRARRVKAALDPKGVLPPWEAGQGSREN